MKKIKVIYIAGTGRCGSTLLDAILAKNPNTFSCGELRYIWDRGILQNRLCGTGEKFLDNPIWKEILKSLYGEHYKDEVEKFSAIEKSMRIRSMLGFKTKSKEQYLKTMTLDYSKELERIIHTISDKTKNNIIIDSSKMPLHGYALSQIESIDFKVIHLIRDNRAVAHSWNTSKFDKGKNGMMNTQSIFKATTEWVFINRWINRYLNNYSNMFLNVSYKELTKNPESTLKIIMNFLDITNDTQLTNGHAVTLNPSPTISGNPIRFNNGETIIKEDNRWKKDMKNEDKLKANLSRLFAESLFFI